MGDRRMKQDFRKVLTSMFGEDGAQQRQAAQAVINPDATVNRESLLPVLPWSGIAVVLPGPAAVNANVSRLAMPNGARVRHVAIATRVPPTGGPLTLRLSGGDDAHSFSLPAGQSTVATGVDFTVAPGAFLSISVVAANGAEDITLTLHYAAVMEG